MYKDTYLRNDADLKPFLHSSGKCFPGAACQAPSAALDMLSQGWSSSLARFLGKCCRDEASPVSRREGAGPLMPGGQSSPPLRDHRWNSKRTIAGSGKAGEGWTEQDLLSPATGLGTDCHL